MLKVQVKVQVAQSCPTLCDPTDYTVHGILQARILEWVPFPFSRRSSQHRDRTQVSHIAGGFFTNWATREVQEYWSGELIPSPGDLLDSGIELGSTSGQVDSLPAELPGKPFYPKPLLQGTARKGMWEVNVRSREIYSFFCCILQRFPKTSWERDKIQLKGILLKGRDKLSTFLSLFFFLHSMGGCVFFRVTYSVCFWFIYT